MKYSLRSLMIAVTLVCVVLGGRIEYLRRWAVFHEREADRYRRELDSVLKIGFADDAHETIRAAAEGEERHSAMAEACRQAQYRPWSQVKEPKQLDSEAREAKQNEDVRQLLNGSDP